MSDTAKSRLPAGNKLTADKLTAKVAVSLSSRLDMNPVIEVYTT